MQQLSTLCLALVVAGTALPAQAQEAEQAGPNHLTVLSYIVPYPNLGQWNALIDSVHTPVLKELVDDGYFLSFGQMGHNWGDEWNAGTYIVSTSHRAFLDGWEQYWARLSERHPGWFDEVSMLFTEHKDNMYQIRFHYDGSQ